MDAGGASRAARGILLLCAACSRASVPGTDAANPSSAPSATAPVASTETPDTPSPPTPAPPLSSAAGVFDVPPAGEAQRTTLAALEREPLLRSQLARLREHFGKDARGPFAMQRLPLAAGRVGILVARPDESDPIVLVLDRDQLLFAKEHPVAGIAAPVLHATLAPAPERGVAVFAYVESMHIVAARMWADDANPYADVEVFHPDVCDGLHVAYQTSTGWIAACTSKTGTHAQRLRDDLTSAWGREGLAVGTAGPVAKETIAFEGSTWILTQRAKAVGGDRTVASRYGADGRLLPAEGRPGQSP